MVSKIVWVPGVSSTTLLWFQTLYIVDSRIWNWWTSSYPIPYLKSVSRPHASMKLLNGSSRSLRCYIISILMMHSALYSNHLRLILILLISNRVNESKPIEVLIPANMVVWEYVWSSCRIYFLMYFSFIYTQLLSRVVTKRYLHPVCSFGMFLTPLVYLMCSSCPGMIISQVIIFLD